MRISDWSSDVCSSDLEELSFDKLRTNGIWGNVRPMSKTAAYQPTAKDMRMVIAASSAGTVFEWYDFFIYGTLAAIIGKAFFPSDNATLEILLVWAGFAVGFGFRPLGAVL